MNLTELNVARTIAARPEAVFDVWMDPRQVGWAVVWRGEVADQLQGG